jgi:PleD family two-component response regulator
MARVLIVQADEQLRADVVADLRAEGHEVLEAASADRGVEAARDADPEIILLDPMLPDRSGYEVYAALQRDPDTVTIPVLFLPGKRRAGQGQPLAGGIDLVTRLGLALRTKGLHDELRLGDPRLRTAVLSDSLTGLANRRAAEERLRLVTGLAQAGGAGPALSASFGVAAYHPGDTWDGLLTRAADALQRAKRTGRNRCEVA